MYSQDHLLTFHCYIVVTFIQLATGRSRRELAMDASGPNSCRPEALDKHDCR